MTFINEIVGKVVKQAELDEAERHADPRVTIEFTDGTRLVITETMQAGWIDYYLENPK